MRRVLTTRYVKCADNKVCDVCKKTFAKNCNRVRHIRQFHGSQFQISDDVSDKIATDYDELKNDVQNGIGTDRDQLNNGVPSMVTPPARSSLENEITDFGISGDTRSHQLVNSAQDDETMQSPNSDQQIPPSI